MRPDDFYLSKANECEQNAADAKDQHTREEWLMMARQWRMLLKPRAPDPKND
jgi:hypothetical protein